MCQWGVDAGLDCYSLTKLRQICEDVSWARMEGNGVSSPLSGGRKLST